MVARQDITREPPLVTLAVQVSIRQAELIRRLARLEGKTVGSLLREMINLALYLHAGRFLLATRFREDEK